MNAADFHAAARAMERRRRYVRRLVKRIEQKERDGVTLDQRTRDAVKRAKDTRGLAFVDDPRWTEFILLADLLGCAFDFPKSDSDKGAPR